jgi:hypothetical protein
MVVYTLIRVVCWSVFLWRVATRCVFNNSVSDFVAGLVVFSQLMLLRLLSSLVNVDCVLTVYSMLMVLCLTVNKVQYVVLIHNRMHSIKILLLLIMQLAIHLCAMSGLWLCGALPSLPLDVFMAWG